MLKVRLYLVLLCFCTAAVSKAGSLPDSFVDIEKFVPGILLEIRYFSDDNFIGHRIRGYEKPKCLLTSEAATALKKVQDELAGKKLALKIYDCYRPRQAVDQFVEWARDLADTKMKSRYYPEIDKKNILKDGYIAEMSGHSRGSTVDLTIVSLDARELDMGTEWDFFDPRSWPSSKNITPAQKTNRMLLQGLMTKHGFTPIDEEWWHFTLRDEPFPERYFNFVIR